MYRMSWCLRGTASAFASACALVSCVDISSLGSGESGSNAPSFNAAELADGGAGSAVSCEGVDVASSAAHCGRCGHDCLGGACVLGRCQPVAIAINRVNPHGLAVDANGVVYWTEDAKIVKCPVTGC